MSFSKWKSTRTLLHCALNVFFIFSRAFKSLWSFLSIITVLINNCWMFFSLLNFFHFDFLSVDDETRTWTIFICHSASLLLFHFTSETQLAFFAVGTAFSFKVFFPTLNSLFVVLFHCQKGKKAHQTFQGAAGSLPVFRRVYWIVKLFCQYCLQRASKQPKNGTVLSYLKKIEKTCKSRDIPYAFCWHQDFFTLLY